MERAAATFYSGFIQMYSDKTKAVHIFCGPGNNGGDGLAVGRLLYNDGYKIQIYFCRIGSTISKDCQENLNRLVEIAPQTIVDIKENDPFPIPEPSSYIIDAIFGSGLNRPVKGYWAKLIEHINQIPKRAIVAVDIPSGLFADTSTQSTAIKADYTLSFEVPKLAFMFPKNYKYVANWEVFPIDLHPQILKEIPTRNYFLDLKTIRKWLKKRNKFDHKGTYGHALIIAGSYGKIGAAILAAKGCMKSGAGLLTTYLPKCGYGIMQIALPEAMVITDPIEDHISQLPDITKYKAIAIGCGLDQHQSTLKALIQLIDLAESPLVLDADALNLISQNPQLLEKLPPKSILTPHPKEFERLFGTWANDFERHQLQQKMAQQFQIVLILKGAHTSIALPDGTTYFNNTGNPGMATAGSGDALTGIITGLLAQGYTPEESAIIGVYLHGLAGDLACQQIGAEALLASDIIANLGNAYLAIRNKE